MNEQKLTTVGEYAYKQSRTRDFLKRYGMALVFIAPHLIFFLAFCIYPLIYGIIMSLFKYNIADPSQNEWRGFGLMDKIKAYKLQEEGMDTVEANLHLGHKADERDYGVGAQILHTLGIRKMRLMTNNPVKRVGLEGYGLEVVENVPIEIEPNDYDRFYMSTKKHRMGHILRRVD